MKNIKYILLIVFGIMIIFTVVYFLFAGVSVEKDITNDSKNNLSSVDNSSIIVSENIHIKLYFKEYEYSGKEIIPQFDVLDNSVKLKPDEFSVDIKNNVNVGIASLEITVKKSSKKYSVDFDIVPSAPKFSDVIKTNEKMIYLKWTQEKNADYYIVSRYNETSKRWEEIFQSKNNNELNFDDKNLEDSTQYKYKISSLKKVENKLLKSIKENEQVQNLKFDSANKSIKWDKLSKGEKYEISVIKPSKEVTTLEGDFEGNVYKIPDNYLNSQYQFKVRGFISANNKIYLGKYSKSLSVTTGKKHTKSNNSKKIISVKNILQRPELPTGCEVTALTILLNHYNFNVDKMTIANKYLPKLDFYTKNGVYYGADFNTTFAGEPTRERGSYGCYAPCIVTTANSYFKSIGSNHKAMNISGNSLDDLLTHYINNDIPVLIWITSSNLHETKLTSIWTTPDGKQVQWVAYEHCVVLTGYDKNANKIYVSDPLVGNTTYDYAQLNSVFKALGQQSIYIDN